MGDRIESSAMEFLGVISNDEDVNNWSSREFLDIGGRHGRIVLFERWVVDKGGSRWYDNGGLTARFAVIDIIGTAVVSVVAEVKE